LFEAHNKFGEGEGRFTYGLK